MFEEIRAMSNRDLLVAFSDAKDELHDAEGELSMHDVLRPVRLTPLTMEEEAELLNWEETREILEAYVNGATEYKGKLSREMKRRDILRVTRRQVIAQPPNVVLLEDYWVSKKLKQENYAVSW